METNTTEYVNSHGKEPRGRGLWLLKLTGTDGEGRYTDETYMVAGTLAQARKQAVKRMKQEIGGVKTVVGVTVLP